MPEERLIQLRRLGGLDGHPDVGVPGIEANSGSLGMGISKGKGMAWAKRCRGPRRPRLRDDRRRRAAGRPELRGAAVRGAPGDRQPHGDRRPQQGAVGQAGRRDRRPRRSRGQVRRRFGWASSAATATTPRRSSSVRSPAASPITDRPQCDHRRHHQGPRRLVHGAPGARSQTAGGLLPLARRRARRRSVRGGARRARTRASTAARGRRARAAGARGPSRRSSAPAIVSRDSARGEPVSQAADARMAAGVTDEYVAKAYGQALVELAATRPISSCSTAIWPPTAASATFETSLSRSLHRERHRRAGHGLDGRRPRAPRPAAGRQLVRQLSRARAPTSRSTTTPASGRGSSTPATTPA